MILYSSIHALFQTGYLKTKIFLQIEGFQTWRGCISWNRQRAVNFS